MRWVQIRAALLMLVVRAVLLTLVIDSMWWLLLIYAGCGWIGWCWISLYRGSRISPAGSVAEGFVLAGLALPDPVSNLGLLYPGLFFRALYGSRRQAWLLLGVYAAAFLGPLAVMQPERFLSAATAFQVAGLGVVTFTMHLLASSLTERERSATRERTLHATATKLVGAVERREIAEIAERAGRRIVGHLRSAHVAVTLHSLDETRDQKGEIGKIVASGSEEPVVRIVPADSPRKRGRGSSMRDVVSLPLVAGGRTVGSVVAESGQPLSEETTYALTTLATHVSLALERADLASELHRREGDEWFRSLVQHSTDITTIYAPDGRVKYASPAMEAVLGYPLASLIGRFALDIVHPDDRLRVLRVFRTVRSRPGSEATVAFRARHRDGPYRYLESVVHNLTEIPVIGGIVANARDATERIEAEQRRLAAEGQYRALVEHVPAVTYVFTPGEAQLTRYISPRIADLTGYPVEQWQTGQNLMLQILHPLDRDRTEDAFAHSLATGEPLLIEHRVIGRDGRTIWFQHAAEMVGHSSSGAQIWHGVLMDITERKEAEQQAQLLQEVSLAISTAANFEEGLSLALRHVCELTGWVYGGSWLPGKRGELLYAGPSWHKDRACDVFAEVSASTTFASGVGLPGLVLKTGGPAWSSSVAVDSNAPRRPAAIAAGLVAGLAVPVLGDGEIIAVLEFFSHESLQEDDRLKTLIAAVASQLGSLVKARRAEAELRRSEEQYRTVVETAVDAIISADSDGNIIGWNRSAAAMFGYDVEEALGRSVAMIVPERFLPAHREGFQRYVAGGASRIVGNTIELFGLRRDGSEFPVEVSMGDWRTGEGIFFSATIRDVTERREFEERLAHQAFHDPLTGLPNRDQFLDRMQAALAAHHDSERPVTVMFLDLDRFKVVNDSLGHAVGDQLLMAVAKRLRDCLEEGAMLARFGGDEFTILLDRELDVADPTAIAECLIEALRAPFQLEGRELIVSTSIGIAETHGTDVQSGDLIRDADLALYQAKARGRGTYAVFEATMNTEAWTRLEREHELRRAIDRDELRVYYQPKVDLSSGWVVSAEALLRWDHPERGVLAPGEIIPLAEETGLIVPIGREVLRRACWQVREWQSAREGMPPLSVSVNVSVRQLQDERFIKDIAAILEETGVDPAWIELELTESAFLEDAANVLQTFHQLKATGLRLAIDDFGAGYSSLTYLQRLPVDHLKLDRSFVHGMTTPSGIAIVSAALELGRSLGLDVVAEGVETADQLATLRGLGCELVQGFYFSAPVPPERFVEFVTSRPLESRDTTPATETG